MSIADVPQQLELDENDEPPVNDDGEFICGRECRDGTRCMADVTLPYIACYQHDRGDPIVEPGE